MVWWGKRRACLSAYTPTKTRKLPTCFVLCGFADTLTVSHPDAKQSRRALHGTCEPPLIYGQSHPFVCEQALTCFKARNPYVICCIASNGCEVSYGGRIAPLSPRSPSAFSSTKRPAGQRETRLRPAPMGCGGTSPHPSSHQRQIRPPPGRWYPRQP